MAKSKEMAQSANVSWAKVFASWQALTKALFDDYHPELHYMRGPGPKWHAKYDGLVTQTAPSIAPSLDETADNDF